MTDGYALGFATPSCEKDFERYLSRLDDKSYRLVRERIEGLMQQPRPPGKGFKILRPPLTIHQRVASCRLRVGPHRSLYDVDDSARRVLLLAIRRRSEETYRE